MSKKSRKNIGKEITVNPQKYSWKQIKIFKTYAEASEKLTSLAEQGHDAVKIRRCGPGGLSFKVITGTRIKSKNDDKQK